MTHEDLLAQIQEHHGATFSIMTEPGGVAVFEELVDVSSEIEEAEDDAEDRALDLRGPQYGRFIGKAKPPTITLRRNAHTGPSALWIWQWHSTARTGIMDANTFRDTTLRLFDAYGNSRMAYTLINAFPTKVELEGMKAGATDVVIKSVTLQCDEIVDRSA